MTPLESRRHRLPRSASLKRHRWIRPLFDRSREDVFSVASGCIRILFRIVNRESSDQRERVSVGFSAGPGVGSAVRRNRIKRLLRESYRLNQEIVLERLTPSGILTFMILYRHKGLKSFHDIELDLKRALEAMVTKLDEALHHG